MEQLPITTDPQVIRTSFENQPAWETICKLVRAPVYEWKEAFHAHVTFLDSAEFRNLSKDELLARVPADYGHSFLLVVDEIAITQPDAPILVVDLYEERGRSFRAIPSTIQSIENNLSLSNMDFFEFADSVDQDGIFRGFPKG